MTCAKLTVLGFLALVALPAHQAAASGLLPSAQPDRMGRTLFAPMVLEPTSAPAQTIQTAPALLPRPANADSLHFTLGSIQLSGEGLYQTSELAKLWQADLGRDIPLSRVYDIADAITRYYWEHGYVLARVSIPAQTVDDGNVRLQVQEGVIANIRYDGTHNTVIDSALQAIGKEQIFNIRHLEQQLLLLNDLSGNSYHSVLAPAGNGAVDVVVIRDKGPDISAGIGLDNHGSRYVGPYLVTASASLHDLPAEFHTTNITLGGATQIDELKLLQLQHVFPLGRPDLKLTLGATLTQGDPGYLLTANDITSKTQQFDAELGWSWLRRRDLSVALTAGLSVCNGNVDVAGSPLSADKTRTLTLGIKTQWQMQDGSSNLAALTLNQGLGEAWGGSANGSSKLSRADGHSDFTTLNLTLSRLTTLNDNFSLLTSFTGQLSRTALLATQEFGYGGASLGRAYDPSEISGDSGLSALAELRTKTFLLSRDFSLQPFLFADYGAVWNRGGNQNGLDRGASLGAGIRLNGPHGLSGELQLAQPLRMSDQSTYRNNGGPRVLFSAQAKF